MKLQVRTVLVLVAVAVTGILVAYAAATPQPTQEPGAPPASANPFETDVPPLPTP
jgi:hypothetical protein